MADYKLEINKIIEKTRELETPVFNEKKAWTNITRKTENENKLVFFSNKAFKYAAIVVLGLFIGFLVRELNKPKNGDKYVEISVKKGQKININLPDGNKISINSNSTIKYPANFEGTDKKIFIEGEAFFEFSENNIIPIYVIVKDVILQGFNSSFNIKTYANNTSAEITVTKGWLTLNNPNANISESIIEQGQTGYYSDELPLLVSDNQNKNFLAWKTGQLHFDEMPLKKVAETLTEFYEIPVQIDGRIKYCNFSSDYNNVELKKIIEDIQRALNTDINIQNNKIIIRGDDC